MKKRILIAITITLLLIICICVYAYFSTNYGNLRITTNALKAKLEVGNKSYITEDGSFNIRLYVKKYNIYITSEDRDPISEQVIIKRDQTTEKEYELNLPTNYLKDDF